MSSSSSSSSQQRALLTGTEREAALREVPQWSEVVGRDALERHYVFANFSEAFAFMTRVALEAEKVRASDYWQGRRRLSFNALS